MSGRTSRPTAGRDGSKGGRLPPLERVRAICRALPHTSERFTWGHPNFRVGEKIFAAYEQHRGRPSICVKVEEPVRLALLADRRYFVPPYSGRHGWVAVYADERPSWKRIESLLKMSYALVSERAQKKRPRRRSATPGS